MKEPTNMPHDPLWPDYDQKRSRYIYVYMYLILYMYVIMMCFLYRKMIILSHYKFYLAFENLQIHDYVSEKVNAHLLINSICYVI